MVIRISAHFNSLSGLFVGPMLLKTKRYGQWNRMIHWRKGVEILTTTIVVSWWQLPVACCRRAVPRTGSTGWATPCPTAPTPRTSFWTSPMAQWLPALGAPSLSCPPGGTWYQAGFWHQGFFILKALFKGFFVLVCFQVLHVSFGLFSACTCGHCLVSRCEMRSVDFDRSKQVHTYKKKACRQNCSEAWVFPCEEDILINKII